MGLVADVLSSFNWRFEGGGLPLFQQRIWRRRTTFPFGAGPALVMNMQIFSFVMFHNLSQADQCLL